MHATDDMSGYEPSHVLTLELGLLVLVLYICQKPRGDASENAPCRVRYGENQESHTKKEQYRENSENVEYMYIARVNHHGKAPKEAF